MTAKDPTMGGSGPQLGRLVPLVVVVIVTGVIVTMGWHRQLSFETLARNHAALRDFIDGHEAVAIAAYVALYVAVVALSIPVGVFLTVTGGLLFGAVIGGTAALLGATTGAICIFLIAKSALGEHLIRRAGPLAEKLARGFRAEAFSYLLFLRLVPIFPFWLINLVPALCGVRLATFAAATALGIVPATFAFAFVGAGLDSVITAQEAAYRSCLATGRADCRLEFHAHAAITPELLTALAALGVLALVPVVVKRLRRRAMDDRELVCVNYHADGCHPWEGDPDQRARHRELAFRHIRAAEILGAKTVRIDTGGREREWSDEQFDTIAQAFRDFAKEGENRGFRIGPETHWGATNYPDNMLKLAAAVGFAAGFPGVLAAILVMAVAAGLTGAAGILTKRMGYKTPMPYAGFLATGLVAAMILGKTGALAIFGW